MEAPNLTQIFGTYVSWKLDSATWIINFMNGSQNMYLLEGNDKALLIDTGWGAGNLRAYGGQHPLSPGSRRRKR